MGKLWAVTKREYLERVRTKWFVIATLFGPILLGAITILPTWLSLRSRSTSDISNVTVIDATGAGLGARVAAALGDTTPGAAASKARVVTVAPAAVAQAESAATHEVMRDERRGYLVLDSATVAGTTARYAGRNASSVNDVERIRDAVRRTVLAARLQGEGLDPARVNAITSVRLRMATERITDGGRGGSGAGTVVFAFVIAFLLYMSIILYGQNVLRGVMEEKSTRVAEVVLSSVRPETLLAGKVLGVGAVGLTQQLLWIGGSFYLGSLAAPFLAKMAARAGPGAATAVPPPFGMPDVSLGVIAALLLFFILGYIFYSSLFAAVGATVNSEQEAQQAATPVMLLVITSALFIQPAVLNPTGMVARVMSWVPFSAPIIMPLRMSLVPVPALEVGATVLGLVAACLLAVWVAARIYRVGLLMYGKRPTVRELARWVRYT